MNTILGICQGTLAAVFLFGVIMLGAASAHTRLHEPKNVATNVVLLALCVLVVIGRA